MSFLLFLFVKSLRVYNTLFCLASWWSFHYSTPNAAALTERRWLYWTLRSKGNINEYAFVFSPYSTNLKSFIMQHINERSFLHYLLQDFEELVYCSHQQKSIPELKWSEPGQWSRKWQGCWFQVADLLLRIKEQTASNLQSGSRQVAAF